MINRVTELPLFPDRPGPYLVCPPLKIAKLNHLFFKLTKFNPFFHCETSMPLIFICNNHSQSNTINYRLSNNVSKSYFCNIYHS